MNYDEETPQKAFLHVLFVELRQVFTMGFKHIVENFLHFIRFGSDGMNKQRLVGRIPVTMDSSFHGQQFIGFDRGDQPEA